MLQRYFCQCLLLTLDVALEHLWMFAVLAHLGVLELASRHAADRLVIRRIIHLKDNTR